MHRRARRSDRGPRRWRGFRGRPHTEQQPQKPARVYVPIQFLNFRTLGHHRIMSKLRILVPIKRVLDYAIKPRVKKDRSGVDLSIPHDPSLTQPVSKCP
jgi:hypothetical protein